MARVPPVTAKRKDKKGEGKIRWVTLSYGNWNTKIRKEKRYDTRNDDGEAFGRKGKRPGRWEKSHFACSGVFSLEGNFKNDTKNGSRRPTVR